MASRLTQLTDIIARNTKKIEEHLVSAGLPALSFDLNGPADFPVPSSNEEISQARRAVVNATKELHDLMVGPRESLRWLAWSYNDNLSLLAISEFKIASSVPVEGDISYDDLAKAVNVNETDVRRLARHAMTNRLFHEPREGYIAHSAASRLLRDDELMIAWVGMCSGDFFKAASHTVEAMVKYPGSQEPSQTGYSLAHAPDTPMFAVFGKDPVRAQRMGVAMKSLTGGEGYEVDYLVNNYPWEELGDCVFVDVGGSFGFVCVDLAKKFPKMRFVVQDLPKTVADGPSKIPAELHARIKFQAHDFYTEQPVKDADVYFFRWVCHNQSDKYGVKMLQQLIPALKPGARIIISDNCLPKPNTADPWDEKITRTMDVTMLSLLNAKERDINDWEELFRMADSRYKFLGSKQPKGSRMSIMEAVWNP